MLETDNLKRDRIVGIPRDICPGQTLQRLNPPAPKKRAHGLRHDKENGAIQIAGAVIGRQNRVGDAQRRNVATVRIDADLGITKKIENDDWPLQTLAFEPSRPIGSKSG
jgi:hypothetical protein